MRSAENPSVKFRSDYEELKKAGYEYIEGTIVPQPISRPHFTLTELRNAIPAHCFKRSTLKSFGYLTLDLVTVSSLYCCAYVSLEQRSLPLYCQFIGYSVYWLLQGIFLFSLWVIGHECGHSAFSESGLVSDTVGFILHSALLVPYHSLKITHRKHHANTGSCENDEVVVPFTENEMIPTWSETLHESPLYHVGKLLLILTCGWMPLYLGWNVWGPKKNQIKPSCHFNPRAAFFLPKQRALIVLSDVGVAFAVVTIGYFISTYGCPIVLRLHFMPYLVMNVYLVGTTYLHHTDTYIPHFREGEWTWLRGNLCTVDRSYGKFLDVVLHHISDTHVCHHIFPKIPFYHCVEATEAIKSILGDYYLKDTTPFYLALWRVVNHCKFIQNAGMVVFYKSKIVKSKSGGILKETEEKCGKEVLNRIDNC